MKNYDLRETSISLDAVFLLGYIIIMLWPSYLGNSIIDLLDNLYLLLAIVYLFTRRYKPSKFIWLMVGFYAYLILITFINQTDMADYHLIVSNLKIILFLATVDCFIKRNRKYVFNILFAYISLMVFIDFMIIILYPNGLYFTENVYNEWSTGYEAYWFLGNKNNHTAWYLLAIILAGVNSFYNNQTRSHVLSLIVSCISIVAMVILDSATSIFIMIIAVMGIILGCLHKVKIKLTPNIYLLMIVYAIILLLILFGVSSFLSPIIEGIFHRDMTFTSRTIVWEKVINQIAMNPLLGYGQISAEYSSEVGGALAFVNSHNQFLQILWQGGIILLLLYIGVILHASNCIKKEKDNGIKLFKMLVFFSLLIKFIFEVEINVFSWLIIMLLGYNWKKMFNVPKGVYNLIHEKNQYSIA